MLRASWPLSLQAGHHHFRAGFFPFFTPFIGFGVRHHCHRHWY
jgi:hypothetical protein